MEMQLYNLTKEQMEDWFDHVKASVLVSLVREGALDEEWADRWAESHTLLLRRKSIFRTITDKWSKEKESDKLFILVVKER